MLLLDKVKSTIYPKIDYTILFKDTPEEIRGNLINFLNSFNTEYMVFDDSIIVYHRRDTDETN